MIKYFQCLAKRRKKCLVLLFFSSGFHVFENVEPDWPPDKLTSRFPCPPREPESTPNHIKEVLLHLPTHNRCFMPPFITFVARQHDGLPLVASFAQTLENLESAKQEARQILRQLNSKGRYVWK